MHGYANSLVFSNFQLVLFSTVQVQFTGIWPILLRSTSLSALSAAQNLRFSRQFRLSADALEEKSDVQVFWILRLPGLKRDLEKKKSATMGSKFQSHFLGWGRAASCSAASAGPEKWSGISQNSKIEWESGFFGCVLQLLAIDQRPAQRRHAENSESIRRGWLHPEFEFEIQKKFHDLAYWILPVSNVSFF